MTTRRTLTLAGVILLATVATTTSVIYLAFANRPIRLPPTIMVQASYPGTHAATVADTVAGPIEQQVNGVEHLVSLRSHSTDDGDYTLLIEFEPGTDLDQAQMLVQNRINLALPVLPAVVQSTGITVRKKSPEPLLFVSLTSPSQRYDAHYLSNYATIQIQNELARVPGVGDIVQFGEGELLISIELDAMKLAAFQLTTADVIEALRQQNLSVMGGVTAAENDQQLLRIRFAPGRLFDAQQLAAVILKTTDVDGHVVLLADVARVKLEADTISSASINGRPAVLLGIQVLPNATPSAVSQAVRDKLAELGANAPDGLAVAVPLDFSRNLEKPNSRGVPEHLVVDVEFPSAISTERLIDALDVAAQAAAKVPGVQDVVALTKHPCSLVRNQPCLVVVLAPTHERKLSREQIADKLRKALEESPGVIVQVSVPSAAQGFPIYGYPIEFVVADSGNHGRQELWEKADALVKTMNQSGKFVDANVGRGLRATPALAIDLDRQRCRTLGVAVSDVMAVLSNHLRDSKQAEISERHPITLSNSTRIDDLKQLRVKDNQNHLVRLEELIRISQTAESTLIERYNGFPVARITANLTEGVSLREAKALCESLAAQEFSERSFPLIWIR